MFFVNSLYYNMIQVSRLLCVYTSEILEHYLNDWQYLDSYINNVDDDNNISWRCIIDSHSEIDDIIEFRYDNVSDPLSSHNPPSEGLKINYILLYDYSHCLALYKLPNAYYSDNIEFNELLVSLKLDRAQYQIAPEIIIDYTEHIANNDSTHRIKFELPNKLIDSSEVNLITKELNKNPQCNNETQIIRSGKQLYRINSTYRNLSGGSAIKSGLDTVKLYKPSNINQDWSMDSLARYSSTIIKDKYDHYWEISNPRSNPVLTSLDTGVSVELSQISGLEIPSIDYIDGNILIWNMNVYTIDYDIMHPSITYVLNPSDNELRQLLISYSENSTENLFTKRVHVMDSLTFDTYIYDVDINNNYTFKSRNFHNLLVSVSSDSNSDYISELHGSGIVAITDGLVIYSLDYSNNSTDIHGHIKEVTSSNSQGGIEIRTPKGHSINRISFDNFILLSNSLFIYRNNNVWYVNEIGPEGNLLHDNLKLGCHSYDLLSINKFMEYDLRIHDQQPCPKIQIVPVNYKGRLLRFDYEDNISSTNYEDNISSTDYEDNISSTDYYFIKKF